MRSTGPRTEEGKLRARQNAVRHGLTAETVVRGLEDQSEYEALEEALAFDFNPQSTMERQLVARTASLLWRLRRALLIETELFEIQAGNLQKRQAAGRPGPGSLTVLTLRSPTGANGSNACAPNVDEPVTSQPPHPFPRLGRKPDTATVYLRLCRFNPGALKRLGRYETALWRQLVQTLMTLDLVMGKRPARWTRTESQ